MTCDHVVADATGITVKFADGVEAAAKLVGTSRDADIAVIQVAVAATELHPLTLGSSDALKVGQGVVALGSPFGRSGTMTTGIVSGLGRTVDSEVTSGKSAYSIPDAVQTDAAINPGNSGGPLLDLSGNVVGVIDQITSNSQSSAGVGFAVPSDIVAIVTRALIDHGEYHPMRDGKPASVTVTLADRPH